MTTTAPLVYRINIAEAKLGVSRSTIYRLIHAGRLQPVKLGARASGITAASVHAMIDGSPAGNGENTNAS